MKSVLIGVLTLIFGLFLGGLAARGEIEKSKNELARVRQACEGTDNLLPMFLGAQGFARAQRESESGEPTVSEHGQPKFLKPPLDGTQDWNEPDSPPGTPDAGISPETFETFKTAQRFRAAFARAAFIEKANLGPDTQKHLDDTVARMNTELARVANHAVQRLTESKAKLKPRQMADLGFDILQAYRKADDDLLAGLDPATQAAMDESEFNLFSQIDLSAFTQVQKALDTMGRDHE